MLLLSLHCNLEKIEIYEGLVRVLKEYFKYYVTIAFSEDFSSI